MSLLLSFLLVLIWNPNPAPDIAGYRLYWYSTEPTELHLNGPWIFSWDAGQTNRVEFPAQDNVVYYFVATCYKANGEENDFSNEVFVISVH